MVRGKQDFMRSISSMVWGRHYEVYSDKGEEVRTFVCYWVVHVSCDCIHQYFKATISWCLWMPYTVRCLPNPPIHYWPPPTMIPWTHSGQSIHITKHSLWSLHMLLWPAKMTTNCIYPFRVACIFSCLWLSVGCFCVVMLSHIHPLQFRIWSMKPHSCLNAFSML